MGSAWLGLAGAVIGGLISLIGTLATSRFQWRQENARLTDQRERDLLQWKEQRETDLAKSERDRQDEQLRWLRDQKLKCYLEALNLLKAASELAANIRTPEDSEGIVAREDELAIVQELRNSYRWTVSASAVCGANVAEKLGAFNSYLYYIIQSTTYMGIKGGMIKLPPERLLKEWILTETIDDMCERLSKIMRSDLGASLARDRAFAASLNAPRTGKR